jgi:SAM-dependent methyltransferase
MIEIHRDPIEDVGGSERAYDRLYEERFSGSHTGQVASRYLWLVSLLKCRPGQRLLDISCGNGYLLGAAAKEQLKGFGLDISEVALSQAHMLAPDAPTACGDAELLPFPAATFDHVTNIGSLEHYLHPERSVAEMARVLRPGGTALILVPNAYGLVGNIVHVWRHGDVFVDDQPLQRYATRGWWTRLLQGNGLQVLRTLRYERELPRTRADLRWQLRHPTKLLRALVSPLIPVNLTDSFVFLCQPQP